MDLWSFRSGSSFHGSSSGRRNHSTVGTPTMTETQKSITQPIYLPPANQHSRRWRKHKPCQRMPEKYLLPFGRLSRSGISDDVRPGTILQGLRDRQRIFFRKDTGETEKWGDESKR